MSPIVSRRETFFVSNQQHENSSSFEIIQVLSTHSGIQSLLRTEDLDDDHSLSLWDNVIWTLDYTLSVMLLLVLYFSMFAIFQLVIDSGIVFLTLFFNRYRSWRQRISMNLMHSQLQPLLGLRPTSFEQSYSENMIIRGRRAELAICSLDQNAFNDNLLQQQQTCVICLEQFQNRADTIATRCQRPHLLHRECLRSWLVYSEALSCPICREPISQNPD